MSHCHILTLPRHSAAVIYTHVRSPCTCTQALPALTDNSLCSEITVNHSHINRMQEYKQEFNLNLHILPFACRIVKFQIWVQCNGIRKFQLSNPENYLLRSQSHNYRVFQDNFWLKWGWIWTQITHFTLSLEGLLLTFGFSRVMEYIYGLKYVFCLASCPVRQKNNNLSFLLHAGKK